MSGKEESFKFSFFERTENDVSNPHEETSSRKHASEVFISQTHQLLKNYPSADRITITDGSELCHVCCNEVQRKIASNKDSKLCEAFEQKSDLVPNIYEGGMKIWEGSLDLVEYLCENKVDLCDKKVLELGCGAGLPGLFALKNGATVHFQDYNEEVIEHMTIPNAFLNGGEEAVKRCKFYSGDWASLEQLMTSASHMTKYDVILTAETIYSPDSYKDLHSILCTMLEATGVIYLAAKVYYFGVGGGVREFEDIISKGGILKSRTVKTVNEGVKREVLEIKFKDAN